MIYGHSSNIPTDSKPRRMCSKCEKTVSQVGGAEATPGRWSCVNCLRVRSIANARRLRAALGEKK